MDVDTLIAKLQELSAQGYGGATIYTDTETPDEYGHIGAPDSDPVTYLTEDDGVLSTGVYLFCRHLYVCSDTGAPYTDYVMHA